MTTANAAKTALRSRLHGLPEKPGVYLMSDAQGKIIYVGKAKVLRNRVRSYFTSGRLDAKTMQLVANIADFDYIVTDTETEALILEATLIKRHKPKYNIIFRDDKSLPFIKVTLGERYPRVLKTRSLVDDGSRYFGPYPDGGAAARTMLLIERLFPLCSQPAAIEGAKDRPCLQYYIHRCMGACAGRADPAEYRRAADEVVLFLEGRHELLVSRIHAEMSAAAEQLRFEKAGRLRDQLRDLATVMERQKVVLPKPVDIDIVGVAVEEDEACVEMMYVRQGRLIGHDHFILRNPAGGGPELVQQSFLEQHYTPASVFPQLVLAQHLMPDSAPLSALLREWKGRKVSIETPTRGEKKALVELAANNARESLERERFKWLSSEQKRTGALVELQQTLNLPAKPARLECFDISNTQGTNPVASMVVFEHGAPARASYRKFRIKSVQGPNDFEMMREALTRRFKRASGADGADHGWTSLPDLLIVDGGKGQLGVAVEVLQDAGLCGIPVIGLAKQHEEIFVPGRRDALILPRTSEALYLLQRIRDEAHRFAITFHRNTRSKQSLKSPLDDVRGIGPRKKQALIRAFGSVAGIRRASVEEIAAVKGIDLDTASRVKEAV